MRYSKAISMVVVLCVSSSALAAQPPREAGPTPKMAAPAPKAVQQNVPVSTSAPKHITEDDSASRYRAEEAVRARATHYVENLFDTQKWVPSGLKRAPAIPNDDQFVSDPNHPITGVGHIVSLTVRQELTPESTLGQRLKDLPPLRFADKFKVRRFDVYVDPEGNSRELGGKQYLDDWSKTKRWWKAYSLLPNNDLTHTMTAVVTNAVSAAGATQDHNLIPLAIGGALLQLWASHKAGVKLQEHAQTAAVEKTAAWAEEQLHHGRRPDIREAYYFYRDALNEAAGSNPEPLNAKEFARRLKARGL